MTKDTGELRQKMEKNRGEHEILPPDDKAEVSEIVRNPLDMTAKADPPSYLLKSEFYTALNRNNKTIVRNIWSNVATYTNQEWSDEQYYSFVTLAYMVRSMDIQFAANPLDAEPREREELRRAKESLYSMVSTWRDKRNTVDNSLSILKERAEQHNLHKLELKMEFTPGEKTPSGQYRQLSEEDVKNKKE